MKFVLFVEGHTENKALPQFLKKWLDTKTTQPVGIKTVRFEGWPELVKDAPKKANLHLNSPRKYDIIAVISLLDLYGPTFYPNDLATLDERYQWAKQKIEKSVNHPGFFQFFAVHEVEAWLLSEPSIFPSELHNAFPGKIKHPECVNFDEPPAKLLERLYSMRLHRGYKKVVDGRQLFGRLDPTKAYRKCPKLRELLDTMLTLVNERMGQGIDILRT